VGAISRVGRRRLRVPPATLGSISCHVVRRARGCRDASQLEPIRTLQQITQLPSLVDPTAAWETLLIYLIPDAGFTAVGVPTDRATAVVIVGLGAVTGVRQRTTAMAISQRHQVT
jgi:hypothetical protein